MTHPLHDPRYQRLAQLLLDERKRAGLLQGDLAEKLSKPQSFVSKYESGIRRLDLIEVLEVLKALDIEPHGFLDSVLEGMEGSIKSLPR